MNKNKLKKRLKKVKSNIKKSCKKVGRNPSEITIVAVSKNHFSKKIKFFQKNNIDIFGENRVQELRRKNNKLNSEVKWHFIGHLQRNKVKYITRMDNCLMIESLDSDRLAKEINKRAKKNNRVMPVLVEVNTSGDENKYGFQVEETIDFLEKAEKKYDNLDIRGLMTIVPYLDNPEDTRPYFKKLANLKNKANKKGLNLTELSMGMTNDYQVAIEEGATIVRIGTALFGERKY
ncbi:MAG TPA: YggS family pyridoxal phosphate-dependent enzyme [Halanaerobiales bacterium]|nr:YggS family pyridoxal phosphate-dependent enzyme [Halanaerobiales bacterium]